MNLKALIKTFTPSKDGMLLIFGLFAILVIAMVIVFGLATAINYGLILLVGEKMTTNIFTGLICGFWFWFLIGGPLHDRYKRIKREIEG